jgi:predicted RNA-binding Zn ribbon-like protein
MEYEELKPAPGPLALVQRFVNTRNYYLYGGDQLGDTEAANAWFAECKLLGVEDRVGEAERRRLVAFREGVREVLLAHNGALGMEAEVLNDFVASAALRVAFEPDGHLVLEPATEGGPVDRVLGRLLAVMVTAEAEGTWGRLKACRNEDCRWAFYDASKNRSGSWCNMAICGARHKMRTYRKRKAGSR